MNKIYEITPENKNYPQKLLKIKSPPKKLYALGNINILNNDSVAIVGSRDSTSYGEHYASIFSKELAKSGICVVSGLAIGIDTICHQNSMLEIGKTIAVIGSGLNNIYPPSNIELAKKIIENNGAVISEYPPECTADLSNFQKRNRIIAGLAKCTIVIEAKYRSGSSITATHTFSQGKKVFCLPGRIGDKTSRGTNMLIKKGANILTDIDDVLKDFGKKKVSFQDKQTINIKKDYKKIYDILKHKSININELSKQLNISISELNSKLTMMELDGFINILPGNIISIKGDEFNLL